MTAEPQATLRVGLLSDSHVASRRRGPGGWWDRWLAGDVPVAALIEAIAAAWGHVDEMWHLGDVAGPELLEALRARMGVPLRVVRGNADRGSWASDLPDHDVCQFADRRILLVHGWGPPRFMIDRICARHGWDWDAVAFGHTHQALVRRAENVLFVNPGSPSDRRFAPHRTVATMTVSKTGVLADLVNLEPHLTALDRPLE